MHSYFTVLESAAQSHTHVAISAIIDLALSASFNTSSNFLGHEHFSFRTEAWEVRLTTSNGVKFNKKKGNIGTHSI